MSQKPNETRKAAGVLNPMRDDNPRHVLGVDGMDELGLPESKGVIDSRTHRVANLASSRDVEERGGRWQASGSKRAIVPFQFTVVTIVVLLIFIDAGLVFFRAYL